MSSDFGKQFTDARTARSITLSEAAEATKVREEYLAAIESGNYDFNLPDIYVRGFIKVYAKYLKLNVDLVMESCPIKEFEVFDSKDNRKISYNTIVTNEKEQDDDGDEEVNDSVSFAERFRWISGNIKSFISNKRCMKITGICLAALLVIVISSKIFTNSGHKKIPYDQINKVLSVAASDTVSLIATGDVKVVVRTKDLKEKLFAGNLESGEVKRIEYSKPIQVFYDKGEYLLIKQSNGEQLYPQPGRGGMEIK